MHSRETVRHKFFRKAPSAPSVDLSQDLSPATRTTRRHAARDVVVSRTRRQTLTAIGFVPNSRLLECAHVQSVPHNRRTRCMGSDHCARTLLAAAAAAATKCRAAPAAPPATSPRATAPVDSPGAQSTIPTKPTAVDCEQRRIWTRSRAVGAGLLPPCVQPATVDCGQHRVRTPCRTRRSRATTQNRVRT